MKKILINPHNCSREEYQQLIDYLEERCWHYVRLQEEQEMIPEKTKKNLDPRKIAGKTCVCGHVIYYSAYHKDYRCMCDKAIPLNP
jgi:hypothetical protein